MSGQPHQVWARSAEVPLDQIVVDRRPWGLGVAAALLRGRRPDPVLPAQPVDPSFARLVASSLKLVGDEAITELAIVGMDVDDGVGQVGVVEVPLAVGSACHYWNPGPVQVVMKLMLLISVKLYNSSIESS